MTKLLIDTQTVVWAMLEPDRLPAGIVAALGEPTNLSFVSIVSPWEMAIKIGTGKLGFSLDIETLIEFAVSDLQARLLGVEPRHLQKLLSLPRVHRDPFDRMLVAQALADDMTIVTPDARIRDYPVPTTWSE